MRSNVNFTVLYGIIEDLGIYVKEYEELISSSDKGDIPEQAMFEGIMTELDNISDEMMKDFDLIYGKSDPVEFSRKRKDEIEVDDTEGKGVI